MGDRYGSPVPWTKPDVVLAVLAAAALVVIVWLVIVGQYRQAISWVGFLSPPASILAIRRSADGLKRRAEDQRRLERWGRAPR